MKSKYNVGDFVTLVPVEKAIAGDATSNNIIWGAAYGKVLRISRIKSRSYWGSNKEANSYPTYSINIPELCDAFDFSELELISVKDTDLCQYDVDNI